MTRMNENLRSGSTNTVRLTLFMIIRKQYEKSVLKAAFQKVNQVRCSSVNLTKEVTSNFSWVFITAAYLVNSKVRRRREEKNNNCQTQQLVNQTSAAFWLSDNLLPWEPSTTTATSLAWSLCCGRIQLITSEEIPWQATTCCSLTSW